MTVDVLERRSLLSGVTPTILANLDARAGGNVVQDEAGNVFGTYVGTGSLASSTDNGGSIYEIPAGVTTPTVIATFGPQGSENTLGEDPGNLVVNAHGDLFGTCGAGGGDLVAGTMWALPQGSDNIQVLARFNTATGAGYYPGRLIIDGAGNLFGVTDVATALDNFIFEYPADGSGIKVVGSAPSIGGLTIDAQGNLFGVSTNRNSSDDSSQIFEIAAGTSAFQTLATITRTGGYEASGVAVDADDNLFVTTGSGGAFNDGALVELPAGQTSTTVLASLDHNLSGLGSPVLDSAGDLFAVAGGGVGATIVEYPTGGTGLEEVCGFTASGAGNSIGLGTDGRIIGIAHTTSDSATVFAFAPPTAHSPTPQTYQFGTVAGRRNVHVSVPLDGGGRAVFALVGPGTGTVIRSISGGFDVSLAGTTAATRVGAATAGRVTIPLAIAELYDDGSILQFVAPKVGLAGPFTITGTAKRVAVGNLNAATISVAASTTLPAGNLTTVTAAAVNQSAISASASLSVSIKSGTGCSLSADTLTNVACGGNYSGSMNAGNMNRVVVNGNLADTALTAFYTYDPGESILNQNVPHVIGSVTIRGSMTSSTVQAAIYDQSTSVYQGGTVTLNSGRIGSVRVGKTVSADSKFFARTLPTRAVVGGKLIPTSGDSNFVN